MEYQDIIYEDLGPVVRLWHNRPDAGNAESLRNLSERLRGVAFDHTSPGVDQGTLTVGDHRKEFCTAVVVENVGLDANGVAAGLFDDIDRIVRVDDVGDANLRALFRQRFGVGLADTAPRARDNRHTSIESRHCRSPFSGIL